MRLIMIGGHDPLCIENVEHLKELQELAKELNLPFVGDDAVIQFKVISIRNSINTSFTDLYEQNYALNIAYIDFVQTNATTEGKLNHICESDVLIYTPSGEHFGIVPIEAMYLRTPVIAVNDGAGPTETVLHEVTGFLCNSSEDDFADAVVKLYSDKDLQKQMGKSCHERINNNFSFKVFSEKLDKVVSI